jgi:hypothetical protein
MPRQARPLFDPSQPELGEWAYRQPNLMAEYG